MSALYKTPRISLISGEGELIFKQANLRGVFVQIIDSFQFFKSRVRGKCFFLKSKTENAHTIRLHLEVRAPRSRPVFVHGECLLDTRTSIYCAKGSISTAKRDSILFSQILKTDTKSHRERALIICLSYTICLMTHLSNP